jgi:hypothetical protein
MKNWQKWVLAVFGGACAGIAIAIFTSSPAKCSNCWGGPCMTSAACVPGCHCIQGTCG